MSLENPLPPTPATLPALDDLSQTQKDVLLPKQPLEARKKPSKIFWHYALWEIIRFSLDYDEEQRRLLVSLWKDLPRKTSIEKFIFELCLVMFHHQDIRSNRCCPKTCYVCGNPLAYKNYYQAVVADYL